MAALVVLLFFAYEYTPGIRGNARPWKAELQGYVKFVFTGNLSGPPVVI
jgi:hypothetical protein